MSLQMVQAIRQEEEAAEQLQREAQATAKSILKTASDNAYKLLTEREEAAEREAAQMIRDAEKSAEGACRKIQEDAGRQAAVIRHTAEANQARAIAYILEEIRKA